MTELDWGAAYDRATVNPDALRRSVSLPAVLVAVGVPFDPETCRGLCPFHDDHDPSLSTYVADSGVERVGCFACDFGPSNDVYDLLRRLRGYSFPEAVAELADLAPRLPAVERASARRTPPRDLSDDARRAVEAARANGTGPLSILLADRGIPAPAAWVVDEFGAGVDDDGIGVVIPHRGPDGTVVAAKSRRPPDWTSIALPGSRLGALYGAERDRGYDAVVLVEGETDTWTAAWLLRDREVDVLGLPSGASAHVRREWVDALGNRDVTILFDADAAGRTGARRWRDALGVVHLARLREGHDVASSPPADVFAALAGARRVGMDIGTGLVEAPFGGYVRAGDDDQVPVSNFTATVVEAIDVPGEGTRYVVDLPNGRAVLPSTELENDGRARRWANAHGWVWWGGTRDCQELLRILEFDAAFLPRREAASVVGWTERRDAFVLPNEVIGSNAYAYVPPVADVRIERQVDLAPAPCDLETAARHLLALHRPDVITPVVGWVAAAFARPFVRAFPILAVVGGAGWGKTTLVREVLATFGCRIETSIDGSTPHAIRSFAAATNALPVWVEEYRASARPDTRMAFENTIRDAWESGSSYKGGVDSEQRQALTELPARAPMAVTGEDVFAETSHVERMVLVAIPAEGRNPEALAGLRAADRRGFGRAFLGWLAGAVLDGTLSAPPELMDRRAHARAVAAWGYRLLADFVGVELPPFDATRIAAAHDESVAEPQVVRVIRACEDKTSRNGPIAWRDGSDWCVQLHELVAEAPRIGEALSGGPRATRAELEERFDVVEERGGFVGTYLRLRSRA